MREKSSCIGCNDQIGIKLIDQTRTVNHEKFIDAYLVKVQPYTTPFYILIFVTNSWIAVIRTRDISENRHTVTGKLLLPIINECENSSRKCLTPHASALNFTSEKHSNMDRKGNSCRKRESFFQGEHSNATGCILRENLSLSKS